MVSPLGLLRRRVSASVSMVGCDIQIKSLAGLERTAAYVAPLLERYKPSSKGEPKVIVIAPTAAEVDHVTSVMHQFRVKSAFVVSASRAVDRRELVEQLRRGSDYVVGTPGRLKWLFDANAIECRSIEAVVLEDAHKLLTSLSVLELMRSAVPVSSQRFFVGESFDEWLEDNLKEARRPGHSLTILETSSNDKTSYKRSSIEHMFCRVSPSDESQQLRYFSEAEGMKKVVVLCRSASDLFIVDQDPSFGDWMVASSSMSQCVRQNQLMRFRTAARAVLVTDILSADLGGLTDVTLIIHWGFPKKASEYEDRLSLLSPSKLQTRARSVLLLRAKEMPMFSRFRSASGIIFTSSPPLSADDLSLGFLDKLASLYKGADREAEDLVRMHGDDFVCGILSIMESRKSLLDKKSPLSGLEGFVPILLVDPFMKKVRNYETAEKLIRACLRTSGVKLGRIALSEKGFLVDVPKEAARDVIDSKHLRKKSLKALHVTQLPALVQSERLFTLRQTAKDRKSVLRRRKSS